MPASRRAFLGLAATGVAARALGATGTTPDLLAAAGPWPPAANAPLRLKAVALDAFPVFSPAPVASRTEALFPGRGAALTDEWRLRQFEYAWLRILSVAHAGWDAAGAKAFGYPTFWVNRADLPPEELGATPDAVGRGLSDLVRFIDRQETPGAR